MKSPDHFDLDAFLGTALVAVFLIVGLLSALTIYDNCAKLGLL